MNKGVSVVLCTYNGKDLLTPTLEHLAAQKFSIPFEIIFVDNASTDGTKAFADEWWENNGSSKIDFKSFEQPIPGKSYAQDLGYEKAQYEYIIVCDDDNWFCDTYIQTAFDIMENDHQIGALGGWCEGVFESQKPDWFDKYTKYYVVVKQGLESGDITDKKGCLYGAGMVLRKSHWLQLKANGFNHILSCRKGDSLSSGGDTEYSYALRLMGYKIWYDERLYFKHFMEAGRLNFKYISRLRKALAASNFILWPYLDLLNGTFKSKRDFMGLALKEQPKLIVVNLRLLMFGNFDQKENAKAYFRMLKQLLLSYKEYQSNYKTISNWNLNTASQS